MLLAAVPLQAGAASSEIAKALTYAQKDDVRWLKSDSRRFLAIYETSPVTNLRGGVLLLHDQGAHPDWPFVIRPLRTALPVQGWDTLSIAIPSMPESMETFSLKGRLEESAKRIERALKEFVGGKLYDMYLVGHGWGALAAAYFLSKNPNAEVTGLVMVGAREPPYLGKEFSFSTALNKILVPVLDIYGEHDFASSRQASARLGKALQLKRREYRQWEIAGTDHNLQGTEAQLIKRTHGWMQASDKGMYSAGMRGRTEK